MKKFILLAVVFGAAPVFAVIIQNVRGIVHDPQHRPIESAQVEIHAKASEWAQVTKTNADGEFQFDAVPVGEYVVSVTSGGFNKIDQALAVTSQPIAVLHFPMSLAGITQTVEVSATPETVNPESSTTQNLLNREVIAETPGADRTDSLAMITNYVPGASMVHDQLHIRGGHQVTWEIDGVPVPNTNIASNVGPQFDPKDIDYMEVQRGGYSAEYGDRTYGVFNVVPRTGFEGNNFGEFSTSLGSFYQTNNYLSFGSHTDRFAYYASLNGNRTDLGLETPTSQVLHDRSNGFGGFASLLFNAAPKDQLRLVSSLRQDHFQVPNDADQQASGIRDVENESDAFTNFSWIHTASPVLQWTISPFYHFNRAHYTGGVNDNPFVPEDDRGSTYLGGHLSLAVIKRQHSASFGADSFAQRDNTFFGITATDGSGVALRQRQLLWGGVTAFFAEDQYKISSWLTLNGGLRYTHYSGSLTEDAFSPRVGMAIRMPKLGWTLRGFYGRYYQAPPLNTVSGPLLDFALDQGFGFLPLKGERDEQWEIGLAIPLRAWTLDIDYFHTRARNFFDHDVLGNSNIFLPLTIDTARIRGWESTLRSPTLLRRLQFHWALSDQITQGRGAASGGLTDFSPPDQGFFYLDHDQRVTLSTGFALNLPWRTSASGNVLYGSGFLNGNGPEHLPGHTTFDLSFEKRLRESWSVRVSGLNLANRRYMLDSSNTFGGSHFANPREIFAQVRYRFHY
jgi:outer membrane receptor protein involved in Fe transport